MTIKRPSRKRIRKELGHWLEKGEPSPELQFVPADKPIILPVIGEGRQVVEKLYVWATAHTYRADDGIWLTVCHGWKIPVRGGVLAKSERKFVTCGLHLSSLKKEERHD